MSKKKSKKAHMSYFYLYGVLAVSLFTMGLLIESLRIPFMFMGVTFAILAFHRDQKVGEVEKAE